MTHFYRILFVLGNLLAPLFLFGESPDCAALSEKAQAFYKSKEYEKAGPLLDSLLLCPDQKANALLLQGHIARREGRFEQALNHFEQSRQSENQPNEQAKALFYKAGIYLRLRDMEPAIETYQQALQLHDGSDDKFLADVYFQLASCFSFSKKEKALEYYGKANEKYLLFGEKYQVLIANIYSNTGSMLSSLGKFDAALEQFTQAADIYRSLQYEQGESNALFLSSEVFLQKNESEKAKKYALKALEILKNKGNERDLSRAERQVGELFLKIGDPKTAFQYADAALLYLFSTEDLDKNRLPKLSETLPFPNDVLKIILLKAQSLEAQQVYSQSFILYEFGLKLLDNLRNDFEADLSKISLFERSWPLYEGGIRCAFKLQKEDNTALKKAFMYAEKSKAVLLLESIRGELARLSSGLPQALLQEEKELEKALETNKEAREKAFLNKKDTDLKKLLTEHNNLKTKQLDFSSKLIKSYPNYHRLKYNSSVISSAEALAALQKTNQGLLSFFSGDENLYVFKLYNGQLSLHQLCPNSLLKQQASGLLQSLRGHKGGLPETAGFVAHSRALYKTILAPLGPLPERLLLVPDGLLGYIPFDVLLSKDTDAKDPRKWPYLLREHAVSYAFSVSAHFEQKPGTSQSKGSFLGMAPLFDDGNSLYPPLRGSREELKRIQKITGGQVFLGPKASKETFKMMAPESRIIHLSSHALAVDGNPFESYIAFSDLPRKTEHKLYLQELYELRLQADLIVLSACETGSGELFRGEGMMSLAHGFSYAGSRSILTTLWPVSHFSTTEIIPQFYQHLSEGLTKEEALRQAKLNYLNQADAMQAHPYFWSPYIPVGDMSAMTGFEPPSSFPFAKLFGLVLAVFTILVLYFYKNKR